MFGSHLSIAGGMVNALHEARTLKLDTVQVFTKNQQQWAVKPLDDADISAWRTQLDELGWNDRTVSHASYLINLASPDAELWGKSLNLMREEVRRCDALSIPHLVFHPGSHKGWTHEEGLARVAEACAALLADLPASRTVLCIENTVGAGSTLGRTFEELARLRELILKRSGKKSGSRVGFCFDTCHAHAGGHDMSSREAAWGVLETLGATLGAQNVRVAHLNDSKSAMGSRLDRHEHIGKGTIGLAGFEAVVNHPMMRAIPKIMETPKGDSEAGTAHDTLNLRRLRKLRHGV